MNLAERVAVHALWRKPSTDGGGRSVSTYVDMRGWDGCMIFVTQGATDATASTGVNPAIILRNSSDASTGGAYTHKYSTGMRWTESTGWGTAIIDIYRPMKRYVSIKLAMTSGKSMGWAFKYAGRRVASTGRHGTTQITAVFCIAGTTSSSG
jgi:hypothetical protein